MNKKILIFGIVLIMMSSLVSAINILASDDLEAYADTAALNNNASWTTGTLETTIVANGSNSVKGHTSTSGSSWGRMKNSSTGSMHYYFSMYTIATSSNANDWGITPSGSPGGSKGVYMGWGSGGGCSGTNVLCYYDTSSYITITSLKEAWHNFHIAIWDDGGTRKWNMTINGTRVLSNINVNSNTALNAMTNFAYRARGFSRIMDDFVVVDDGGEFGAPPIVPVETSYAYYYNNSIFETEPSKIEVDLVGFNLTNNTIGRLFYGNQSFVTISNVTNQTNARFYVENVTSYLISAQSTLPLYFNFSLNHTNGSMNTYNTSNASQTLNLGCYVNDITLGVGGLLGENQTYVSRVNVSTLGLCKLTQLKYQLGGAFYSQSVLNVNTDGQTVSNLFDFNVDIPFTYFNNSQKSVNITAEFLDTHSTYKRNNKSKTANIVWNLTKHPRYNITAYDLISNAVLTNFSVFNGRHLGTLNGTIFWWEFGTGVHEIGVNNTGFELVKKNLTFTAGTFNHQTYYLYTTNSFNFTFKDERTDELITQNVSLEFIGDAKSYNFTAYNGKLYVDLLVPSNYTIRYQSNPAIANRNSSASVDYGLLRSYLVKLTDQSHQDLTLYMIDNGNSTTTKITVYDQNTLTGIEGAAVYIQRYFLQPNAYRTVAMCTSGVAGECDVELEHNAELYKFKVDFPWQTTKITTVPTYVSTTTLNLYINLFATLGESFFEQEGIEASMAYSSSTSTFTASYTDSENIASEICLRLKTYGTYSKTTLNESCSSSTSGSLIVTGFAANKNNYGVLTATIDGNEKVLKSVWKDLNTDKLVSGSSGIFLTAMIFIMMVFLSVVHVYAAILGSVGLLFAYLLGLIVVDLTYIILVLASSIILAMIIQMKK
tara:strand:- start:34 stop:2679 length:2646 start_codon:yes stop_codon:yes gene_type:complete